MNNKRKKMIKEMVDLYGSEHELVKFFTELCEKASTKDDKMLEMLVQCHKEYPVK